MEAEKIFVPYNCDESDPSIVMLISPYSDSKTKEQELKIKKMIAEGWSIVATVPVIASKSYSSGNTIKEETKGHTFTYTKGYEVWLQRI